MYTEIAIKTSSKFMQFLDWAKEKTLHFHARFFMMILCNRYYPDCQALYFFQAPRTAPPTANPAVVNPPVIQARP